MNLIGILSAHFLSLQTAAFLELGDDTLHRSFGNANSHRDFA